MKRMTLFIMSVVLLIACSCACDKNMVQPETSIVYIGPKGETLEHPYEAVSGNKNNETSGNDDREDDEDSFGGTPHSGNESVTETSAAFDEEAEIDKAISRAEALLSEGKYDAAIASMIEIKNRCSDRSRIYAEEERINSYRPVALYDLDPMTYTDDEYLEMIRWKADRELNTGESGKTGIGAVTHELLALIGYPGRTHAVASANFEYYVNGKYDQLSGVFALSGCSDEHKNTPFSLSLNVYADNVLIYTSEEITKGSMPIDVKIDLPSTTQLVKIEFVTSTTNIKGSVSVERQYGSCLVDAFFSKKYVPLA